MARYANLTGWNVGLRDGNLSFNQPAPQRPFVYILGTASDGPIETPILVDSVASTIELYGGTSGTLINKIVEAKTGEYSVFAYRLGNPSTATLDVNGDGTLVLTAVYPGTTYHNLYAEITAAGILRIYNWKTQTLEDFTISSYASNADLVAAINSDDDIRKVIAASTNALTAAPSVAVVAATYMTGGTDVLALTYDELYTATVSSLAILDSSIVDYIVVAGAHADATKTMVVSGVATEVNAGFGDLLANFCEEMNQTGQSPTLSVISVSGAHTDSQSTYNTHLDSLVAKASAPTNSYPACKRYVDSTTTPAVKSIVDYRTGSDDYGKYLSIVMAEPVVNNSLGLYYPDGDGIYAGLMASLPSYSACTGKEVPQTTAIRNGLSRTYLNDIVGGRMIAFDARYGDVAVSDAPSSSQSTSDWNRNQTVRIVQALVEDIKDATRPFIGEGMNKASYMAMRTKVQDVLDKHQNVGALNDSTFQIVIDRRSQILGEATIELVVEPAFELRKIFINIALNQGRAVTQYSPSA